MLLTISFHLKRCITLFLFLIISGGKKHIFLLMTGNYGDGKALKMSKIISAGDYLVYLDK